jgi:hypothetical protein
MVDIYKSGEADKILKEIEKNNTDININKNDKK